MKILFYGDIVGELGREAFKKSLPLLVKENSIDFVIANAENATHGKGFSQAHYKLLRDNGADCLTLGNHYRSKSQIDDYIDDADILVRPLNAIAYHYGKGSKVFERHGIHIRVTNLLGQAFLTESVINPYLSLNDLLPNVHEEIHIVDFHAESTSEKEILGYVFDGKVSAVIGTHTHVQTNDARILPKGTAFISDVGMTGEKNGVIGFNKESVINKIVMGGRGVFELDKKGLAMVNAAILTFDEKDYHCVKIEQVYWEEDIQ